MARAGTSWQELELRAAWSAYLIACRSAVDYDAVDPYAWARLQDRLRAMERLKK